MVFFAPVLDVLDGKNPIYGWKTWACAVGAALSYVISYSAENIIMWYFGYHYYNCGKKLAYSLSGEPLPPNLERNHRLLYRTVYVINVCFPLAYASISFW